MWPTAMRCRTATSRSRDGATAPSWLDRRAQDNPRNDGEDFSALLTRPVCQGELTLLIEQWSTTGGRQCSGRNQSQMPGLGTPSFHTFETPLPVQLMDSSSEIRTIDQIDAPAMGYDTSIVQAGITNGTGSLTWKFTENADPPFWFGAIDNSPFSCCARSDTNCNPSDPLRFHRSLVADSLRYPTRAGTIATRHPVAETQC